MRRIIFALLAACIIFTLCSCGGDNNNVVAPEGTTYVENTILKVSTCYPLGWTVDRNDGMLSLLKDTSSSTMVSTYASVSVTRYSTDKQSSTEYWEEYASRLESELKEYKLIEHKEIKIEKNTANQYHYTAKVDGDTYHFVQAIAVGGYSAYIITFTASEADYETVVTDFNTIISNFSFK